MKGYYASRKIGAKAQSACMYSADVLSCGDFTKDETGNSSQTIDSSADVTIGQTSFAVPDLKSATPVEDSGIFSKCVEAVYKDERTPGTDGIAYQARSFKNP
jgi:hypothetical protein